MTLPEFSLSVIFPTLNEAAGISHVLRLTLERAAGFPVQLVVADCQSRDNTAELARLAGATVCTGAHSRASAMNLGASHATGSVLLFVHADTQLPEGFPNLLSKALSRPHIIGGAFDFNFAPHPLNHGYNRQGLRAIRIMNRIRFRWTGAFYGDQAIFARSSVFHAIGGFPNVRLLEDALFSTRLRKAGKVAVISPPVKTCPRRFVTRGVFRQLLCDMSLITRHSMGLSTQLLQKKYNALNHTARYATKKSQTSPEV